MRFTDQERLDTAQAQVVKAFPLFGKPRPTRATRYGITLRGDLHVRLDLDVTVVDYLGPDEGLDEWIGSLESYRQG